MPLQEEVEKVLSDIKNSPTQFHKRKFSEIAENLINIGQLDLCLNALDEFEQIVGKNSDTSVFRGIVAVAKKDYSLAEKLFLEAIEFDKTNVDAFYNLAWVYENTKRYEDAKKGLLKALSESKTDEEKREFQKALVRVDARIFPGTNILIRYNTGVENFKLCVSSIQEHTNHLDYNVFILCSSENVAEVLRVTYGYTNIEIVECSSNYPIMQAYRKAFKSCDGNFDTLFISSNTVVTPNWLDNMKTALHHSNRIGAVSCMSNSDEYYQAVEGQYKDLDGLKNFGLQFNVSNYEKWETRIKLSDWAVLVKNGVFGGGKIIDELYSYPKYAFDDMCVGLQKKGFLLILCRDVFIHHFRVDNKEIENAELFNRDEQHFEKKWGFNNFYSMCIRGELIDFIKENRDSSFNVLEVGSACGATLLRIQNEFKKAKTYGIELNKQSASIASIYFPVICCNVEQETIDFEKEYFDYIIFGDVLEHLNRPDAVISNMKKYLKKGGKILISLPNVAHFSVISELLRQNWEYVPSGLLDITHIRFFNISEIEKLALSEGYSINKVRYSEVPRSKNQEIFISNLSALIKKDLTKYTTAYQYLVEMENIVDLGVRDTEERKSFHQNFESSINIISELINSQKGIKKTLIVNIQEIKEFNLASSKIKSQLYATVKDISDSSDFFCDDRCLRVDIGVEKIVEKWRKKFDAIVIDEELEKSMNPWQFLSNLKNYLSPSGVVVAGVKNVANVRVINNLLSHKKWQFSLYDSERENIRFFTGKSVEASFAVCKYKIEQKEAVKLDLTKDEHEFFNKLYENRQNISMSEEDAKEALIYKYYYILKQL